MDFYTLLNGGKVRKGSTEQFIKVISRTLEIVFCDEGVPTIQTLN